MKRLLLVLFGVLVFQGSVFALPSGGDLCQQDGDGDKARVLSPADTQQLNKGSAILLQWKDSEDWLGNKVTIELQEAEGFRKVVKTWPLQINTGSALITRADLRGAKIKKASKKDIRYVFRLKNHAKAKRFIDSGCFTFTKSEKSQRQRRNLKEEIEGLESTLTQALVAIRDLTDRLDALEGEEVVSEDSGGVVAGDHDVERPASGGEAISARVQPGTLWREVVEAGEAQNPDLQACWCVGPRNPAVYCSVEGWVAGRNGYPHRQHAGHIQAIARRTQEALHGFRQYSPDERQMCRSLE